MVGMVWYGLCGALRFDAVHYGEIDRCRFFCEWCLRSLSLGEMVGGLFLCVEGFAVRLALGVVED